MEGDTTCEVYGSAHTSRLIDTGVNEGCWLLTKCNMSAHFQTDRVGLQGFRGLRSPNGLHDKSNYVLKNCQFCWVGMSNVCIRRKKIRWCLQWQNLVRSFITGLKPCQCSHKRGFRRLYCGPRIRMIRPVVTKLAARINVGPIMVVVILEGRLVGCG